MADLTATQISTLRRRTGDTNAKAPDLEDSDIQALYAEAEDDLDLTTVYILRERYGMSLRWTDHSGETRSESRSQRRLAIKEALDYWEERTGLKGGAIRVGALNLDLDYDEDEDAELGE
jgi:hypothetical protein